VTSCAAQIDCCREIALRRSWNLDREYVDEAISSETLDRPALRRLLADIEAGHVKRLVVTHLDRLTRKLLHLHELMEVLQEHGVELLVGSNPEFNDTASSRLLTNIIAAASEFEMDLTRERMADRRAALKKRGKRVAGRVPFGYVADPVTKELKMHPEQSVVVRDVFWLASKGSRPSEIATLANNSHWVDQRDETGRWTARRVLKMLTNPTYAGDVRYGANTRPGDHQGIVSREVFEAAARHIRSRRVREPSNRTAERNNQTRDSHLLGLLVCGQCKRLMTISVSYSGSKRYVYFRCQSNAGGRPSCPGVNVSRHAVELATRQALADLSDESIDQAAELRSFWNSLSPKEQELRFGEFVKAVEYDHKSAAVTLDLLDPIPNVSGLDDSWLEASRQ
jgi:site-specific DNA recombinase